MDNIRLTKDADALLCVLYKTYKDRRASGTPKAEAKVFSDSDYIHKNLMPKWSFEDVDETCRELDRAGMLHCRYADDVTWMASLTDSAIIYQENRFADSTEAFLGHIEKLRNLIPW